MRFAGLSYKTAAGSPMSAPKGKIPYIENIRPNATPEMMADSGQIIGNLVADGALPDLNVRLSGTEKAHDMALRALLEDKLYFYNVSVAALSTCAIRRNANACGQGYEKWHENYYTMRDYSLSAIPGPVRIIIGIMAYRKTMRTMYGQGTARFSWDEITGFIEEIWANVSELLIESKRRAADDGGCFWALGKEEPTEADTVLFGFVVAVLICEA